MTSLSSITHYLDRDVIFFMISDRWYEKFNSLKMDATILLLYDSICLIVFSNYSKIFG